MQIPEGKASQAVGTASAKILKVHPAFKDQQGTWCGRSQSALGAGGEAEEARDDEARTQEAWRFPLPQRKNHWKVSSREGRGPICVSTRSCWLLNSQQNKKME